MEGLNMYNAQGNYDQGRGPDGLNGLGRSYAFSRFGTSIPASARPAAISGKPRPPGALDPRPYLPKVVIPDKYPRPPVAKVPAVMPWRFRGKIKPPRRFTPIRRRRRRPNKAAKIRNRRQFVTWLKNWSPGLYAAAKRRADITQGREGALGELGGWWDTFTEGLTDVGGQYLQYKTQKEILDAQLERMRAGLPPLDTSQYAPTFAVKVDPGTTAEITGAIGAGLGKMLPFIAIGGAALFLMMRKRR